jgi:hypothetical protein
MNQISTQINPETVTTSQLLGSFTAKHWWLTGSAVFTLCGAIFGAGYWAGQHRTEINLKESHDKTSAEISRLERKLSESLEQAKKAAQLNLEWQEREKAWRDHSQKLVQSLNQKNTDIDRLVAQVGKANNCGFIHEQIKLTQREIANSGTNGIFVWLSEKEEAARKATLEQRLTGYQQQLVSCNR